MMRGVLASWTLLSCAALVTCRAVDAGSSMEIESLPRTTLVMGGRPVVVTKMDADRLARDLVESLRRSPLDDQERAALLSRTSPQAFIDPDGTLRVAPWVLTTRGDEWVLMLRFLPPDPAQNVAFVAPVTLGPAGLSVGEVRAIVFHRPAAREP